MLCLAAIMVGRLLDGFDRRSTIDLGSTNLTKFCENQRCRSWRRCGGASPGQTALRVKSIIGKIVPKSKSKSL
jgi:hypothetical protein